jgi:phospholipid/cholesterol/gamma-HCH transport system ATP-binding protein
MALAKRHSLASAQRCTQTEPSAAVSVLMHTPRSGHSVPAPQATVHSPTWRPVRRLLNITQRGVDSAHADDDWHEPYAVSLRDVHARTNAKTKSHRGVIGERRGGYTDAAGRGIVSAMIEVANVWKRFAAPVLRDVTLRVPTGCLYGLIGPGAAGKSVLLKCLAGLLRPERGSVRMLGQAIETLDEVSLQAVRNRVGMLFQNNALFDHLTVAENIAFPLRRRGVTDEAEIAERVADRLRAVSLGGFEERLPGGLSGGQKKRVGVARATVTRAEVVLYDEPAAGLDPVTSQKIFDLLRREQQESGATVIMVSSDIDRLLTVTDRVGMMLDGALLFDGTTAEALGSLHPVVKQFVHGEVDGPL